MTIPGPYAWDMHIGRAESCLGFVPFLGPLVPSASCSQSRSLSYRLIRHWDFIIIELEHRWMSMSIFIIACKSRRYISLSETLDLNAHDLCDIS